MDSTIYKSISDQLRQRQTDILQKIAALNGELKGLDRAIAVIEDVADPNSRATPLSEEEVIDWDQATRVDIAVPEFVSAVTGSSEPTPHLRRRGPRPTQQPRDGSIAEQITEDIRKMILARGSPMTGPKLTKELLKNPPSWTAGWAVITDHRVGQVMARQRQNFINLYGRGYWPRDVNPPAVSAGTSPGITTEDWQKAAALGRSQTANEFYLHMHEILLRSGKPLNSKALLRAAEETKPLPAWINGWANYNAATIAARLSNSKHLFVNIKGRGYWPTDVPAPAEDAEAEPAEAEPAEAKPATTEPQEDTAATESEPPASQWPAAAFYADVRKLLLEAGRPITSTAMTAIFSQMEPRVWSEKWTSTDAHAYSSRLSRRSDQFVNIPGHGYWVKDAACPLVGYEPEEPA